ncbi:MAG: sigma-70 family RNA polymerase sigma factor [Lachnospiraceae bacterium]|nr:sigma-70 family RNA polymerase sigma factor [Lachnospiraceae bacterium]
MSDLNNLTDEELVRRYREGVPEAVDFLLQKYKPLVKNRAMTKYLKDGEADDLIQEGMIGLYKAVRDYEPENERGASFFTFAALCIDRQLMHAIEASSRQKRRAQTEAVLLTEDEWESYMGPEESPEKILLDLEVADETYDRIFEALSGMEKRVFNLQLCGYDYREIADILGKTPKSIDNAIQRIRRKTKEQTGGAK